MKIKTLLAALGGGIIFWLLGAVFYLLLLGDYFHTHMGSGAKDPVEMPFVLAGCLVFGFLLAFIYNQWAGIKTLQAGAQAGAMIGFIAHLSFGLIKYGDVHFYDSFPPLLAELVVSTLMSAGAGAVVGWILGTGRG